MYETKFFVCIAMRIQISQQTHDALSTAKPRFFMHKRGEIEVKVRTCFYTFRQFHLTLTTFVLTMENSDNLYLPARGLRLFVVL